MKEQSTNEGILDVGGSWLRGLRAYLAASIMLHGVWETLQLPLYTIWYQEPWSKQLFAVVHCTLGDAIIAAVTLMLALVLAGYPYWPERGLLGTVLITIFVGLGFTVYSEYMNVKVRASWAYAPAMPIVPPLGTGLSPLLQWIAVPLMAFGIMRLVLRNRR